jgi:hypothetical protein
LFHDGAGLSRLKTRIFYNNFIEIIYFSYILKGLRPDDPKIRNFLKTNSKKGEGVWERKEFTDWQFGWA